ncbi:hypothetical protein [Candidatus Nitrososphaera evergladensis]|uniref:hypothetical protein n=1 Tax=Candidatus Nitrososphaera evergladensis TaxID=1459637 RepID=UPI00130E3E08|nr:hypothetical protein [Candidatus Nitrososphaera evergladensis]
MVSWSYIVVCKKCGYISAEKLPEQEAKDLRRSHLEGSHGCTISHITLMKVRT